MIDRVIAAFALLLLATLAAAAADDAGRAPAQTGAFSPSPAASSSARAGYWQLAQRTPDVPPPPKCNVSARGTGTWKEGDVIPTGSVTGSCQQTMECIAKPEGDDKPNAACGFMVHHTADLKVMGTCDGNDCKKCTHDPIKDKCEWWLDTK